MDQKIDDEHCKELHRRADRYKEASPFIQALKPAGLPTTVVYPFGGGDLISALTTYPEAKEITTMSLEHAGIRAASRASPPPSSRPRCS